METRENGNIFSEDGVVMEQELKKLLKDLRAITSNLLFLFGSQNDTGKKIKAGKYLLTNPNNSNIAKCMVTIVGNSVNEADLALKLSKSPGMSYQSRIYPDKPWRLHQLQDSMNQIQEVDCLVCTSDVESILLSRQHVLKVLEEFMYHIKSAKDCLMLPKRKTLEELVKNPLNGSFNPALPNELVVSFYVQGCKLIMAVYHLYTNQNGRVDISNRHQTECVVPWLNDVNNLLIFALWKCQQLKDKLHTLELMKECH